MGVLLRIRLKSTLGSNGNATIILLLPEITEKRPLVLVVDTERETINDLRRRGMKIDRRYNDGD